MYPSGSYSAVESCEQKINILIFFHPDLKSKYCFYAHMHEIMKLNRSKSACRIHWGTLGIPQLDPYISYSNNARRKIEFIRELQL